MLKKVIENYVKKTKNSTFSFDKNISSSLILSFAFKKSIALLRSLKMLSLTKGKKKVFLGKSVEFFNKKNIVIGNNKNWKQNIKIGKRNNQNFVQIPHATLIEQIQYKA